LIRVFGPFRCSKTPFRSPEDDVRPTQQHVDAGGGGIVCKTNKNIPDSKHGTAWVAVAVVDDGHCDSSSVATGFQTTGLLGQQTFAEVCDAINVLSLSSVHAVAMSPNEIN
jgi:hypothetical protein